MPTFDFGGGPVPAHQHLNGGGWVAETAWVAPTAFVGPNALVYDEAKVCDCAIIEDHSRVFGKAKVRGHAELRISAQISGEAVVEGRARVSGAAKVFGNAHILDLAKISGNSVVCGGEVGPVTVVCGRASVSGVSLVHEAMVTDDAHVCGTHVHGDSVVGSNQQPREEVWNRNLDFVRVPNRYSKLGDDPLGEK